MPNLPPHMLAARVDLEGWNSAQIAALCETLASFASKTSLKTSGTLGSAIPFRSALT